jgi:hypothetical protein
MVKIFVERHYPSFCALGQRHGLFRMALFSIVRGWQAVTLW